MDRRTSLKALGSMTMGAFLLQSCHSEPHVSLLNFQLQQGDYTALDHFFQMILPIDKSNHEDRIKYVLSAIDHTYTPEDISKFIRGLEGIRGKIIQDYNLQPSSYKDVPLEEYWETFQVAKNDQAFFLSTSKELLVQYHTTTKTYSENVLRHYFMPSKYNGCTPLG